MSKYFQKQLNVRFRQHGQRGGKEPWGQKTRVLAQAKKAQPLKARDCSVLRFTLISKWQGQSQWKPRGWNHAGSFWVRADSRKQDWGWGSSWKSLGVEGHYVCLQISKRTFAGIREEPISKAWTGWN